MCEAGWTPVNPTIACPANSAVHHIGRFVLFVFVCGAVYLGWKNAECVKLGVKTAQERFHAVKYQQLGPEGGDLEHQGIDHALDTFVDRDDFLQASSFDDDAPAMIFEEDTAPKMVRGQADSLTTPIPALFAPGSAPVGAGAASFGTMDDLL